MNRQEALEFVKASQATGFRYGDLSVVTSREDAIIDIQAMEDEAWGDGEIFEEE